MDTIVVYREQEERKSNSMTAAFKAVGLGLLLPLTTVRDALEHIFFWYLMIQTPKHLDVSSGTPALSFWPKMKSTLCRWSCWRPVDTNMSRNPENQTERDISHQPSSKAVGDLFMCFLAKSSDYRSYTPPKTMALSRTWQNAGCS